MWEGHSANGLYKTTNKLGRCKGRKKEKTRKEKEVKWREWEIAVTQKNGHALQNVHSLSYVLSFSTNLLKINKLLVEVRREWKGRYVPTGKGNSLEIARIKIERK